MKKRLLLGVCLVVGAGSLFAASFGGYKRVFANDYGPRTSATLNSVITDIDTDQTCLVITRGQWSITNDVTIPTNVIFEIDPDSSISVDTGVTFTFATNSALMVPRPHTIFVGSGTVTGAPLFFYRWPEWGSSSYDIGNGRLGFTNLTDIVRTDQSFTMDAGTTCNFDTLFASNLTVGVDLVVSNDLDVGGDLGVTGDADITGDLDITGYGNFGGAVTGESFSTTGDISGATATISGSMTVGDITSSDVIGGSNIVDGSVGSSDLASDAVTSLVNGTNYMGGYPKLTMTTGMVSYTWENANTPNSGTFTNCFDTNRATYAEESELGNDETGTIRFDLGNNYVGWFRCVAEVKETGQRLDCNASCLDTHLGYTSYAPEGVNGNMRGTYSIGETNTWTEVNLMCPFDGRYIYLCYSESASGASTQRLSIVEVYADERNQ